MPPVRTIDTFTALPAELCRKIASEWGAMVIQRALRSFMKTQPDILSKIGNEYLCLSAKKRLAIISDIINKLPTPRYSKLAKEEKIAREIWDQLMVLELEDEIGRYWIDYRRAKHNFTFTPSHKIIFKIE